MKWIGVIGSRLAEPGSKAESDAREEVRKIIARGDGVVSGGALGIDYFATDEALKSDPTGKRVKIFLPVMLDLYARHYNKRKEEGVITKHQVETLIAQLTKLKETNPQSLIENTSNKLVNEETYYERNTEIVNASDEIIAFRVTNSGGTQDTINKARENGIPVREFKY